MYRTWFAVAAAGVMLLTSAPAKAALGDGVAASVPAFVQHAALMGPAAPWQRMYLVVHLAYPNPAAVDNFIKVVHDPSSPEFRHFLTPQQFDGAFAPSQATYASVERALVRAGFTIYRTYSNRKIVDVVGTVTQVNAYFNTLIERYAYFGRTFYGNTLPAQLPAELRGTVIAVSGFNNHDQLHTDLRITPSAAGALFTHPVGRTHLLTQSAGPNPAPAGQFGPREIELGYDYPEVSKAANNGSGSKGRATIAIETAFDYSDNDLQDFWTMFNIPRSLTPGAGQPYVLRRIVDCPTCSGQGIPAPEENIETTVDVQQSSSNAPGANVLVYEGTNNLLTTFDDIYVQVVQDPRVDVVTTSWGLCESDENSNEVFADNDIFKQGAAEGQTMFAASGDNGSADGCQSVANGPNYPASSPYVGGSGGTNLTLNANDTWNSETASSSSGGGVSVLFALPSYQAGIPGLQSTAGRNVPDLALNYNSYTFCYGDTAGTGTCATPKALVVNGTSLVAPNMAAAYAAFDAYYGKRLGLAQTGLYNGFVKHTYPLSPTKRCIAWHDITSGSNGIYSAHAGYDDVTGVGSLDMNCYMLQLPHSGTQAL